MGTSNLRLKTDFQLSVRTALSVGVVAAVLLTAALVYLPWSLASRSNIADLNGRLNALVIRTMAEKVDALLDNAVAAREAIATNLGEGVIDIGDKAKRAFLFLSFMQSQPSLTAIEFARPDDRSYLACRGAGSMIRMQETMPDGGAAKRVVDMFELDKQGALTLERSETGASDYLPTQQFWYQTAFDKDQAVWSNIYRLPAYGRYGVTTTQAVMQKGVLLGVLGVSISLDRLSSFLDGTEVSPHGTVFLTNIYDELVAVQRRMAQAGDPAEMVDKLEAVKYPSVEVVVGALKANELSLAKLGGTRQLTYYDTARGESYFITLAPLAQMGLIVAVVIPEEDVLSAIERNEHMLLFALGLFLVLIVAAATFAARQALGLPLARMTANLKELEDFRLDQVTAIPSRLSEIRQVSAATMRMAASLASFKKYIPTELVRGLFARGMEAELGGERRELTILFIDLAHFTQIAERLGERVVEFLGIYLSEVSAQIQAGQGTIDKYIGDAVMAFWGAPEPNPLHALAACRAALACQRRLAALRLEGASDTPLEARIGINTGIVLVGNVGSPERLNYTVIGDPVNVASRLEALNKLYGTQILIGERTREEAGDAILVRPLDRVAVYGKETGVEMYELVGLAEEATAETRDWIALYEAGRAAFRAREWDRAIALFREVIARHGGSDSVSALQIARAETFKAAPPPADWDGLVVMETK
jgi:adenylate cyclase